MLIQPMLIECWATVFDAGPTFNQLWVLVAECVISRFYLFLQAAIGRGGSIQDESPIHHVLYANTTRSITVKYASPGE